MKERDVTEQLVARLGALAPWHFDLELAPGVRTSMGNRTEYASEDHRQIGVVDPFELKVVLDRVYPGEYTTSVVLDPASGWSQASSPLPTRFELFSGEHRELLELVAGAGGHVLTGRVKRSLRELCSLA